MMFSFLLARNPEYLAAEKQFLLRCNPRLSHGQLYYITTFRMWSFSLVSYSPCCVFSPSRNDSILFDQRNKKKSKPLPPEITESSAPRLATYPAIIRLIRPSRDCVRACSIANACEGFDAPRPADDELQTTVIHLSLPVPSRVFSARYCTQ